MLSHTSSARVFAMASDRSSMAEPTANRLADHDWDILVLSGFLVITIDPLNKDFFWAQVVALRRFPTP